MTVKPPAKKLFVLFGWFVGFVASEVIQLCRCWFNGHLLVFAFAGLFGFGLSGGLRFIVGAVVVLFRHASSFKIRAAIFPRAAVTIPRVPAI